MSFTGQKLRAILEDLGFLVVVKDHERAFYVRTVQGRQLAMYELHADEKFSWGWVEYRHGGGRRDCLDWPTFYDCLNEAAR